MNHLLKQNNSISKYIVEFSSKTKISNMQKPVVNKKVCSWINLNIHVLLECQENFIYSYNFSTAPATGVTNKSCIPEQWEYTIK